MSLRSSLSRLLRTRVHSVLKKSVHSVAVIGAPFSQGQVRTGTWHGGAEPGESEGGVRDGEAKRRWGETEGHEVVGSRYWAPGEHVGFSLVEDEEGDGGHPVCAAGGGPRAGGFLRPLLVD